MGLYLTTDASKSCTNCRSKKELDDADDEDTKALRKALLQEDVALQPLWQDKARKEIAFLDLQMEVMRTTTETNKGHLRELEEKDNLKEGGKRI